MVTYIDASPKELRNELEYYNNYIFWHLANKFLKTYYQVNHCDHDVDGRLQSLKNVAIRAMSHKINITGNSTYNEGYYILSLEISTSELITLPILIDIYNSKLDTCISNCLTLVHFIEALQSYNSYLAENCNKQLVLHPDAKRCIVLVVEKMR